MEMPNKNNAQLVTFLSPNVRHLLVEIGESYTEIQENCYTAEFITNNLTFNWKNITPIFGDLTENFNIHLQPVAWFEAITQKLWPVFVEAHNVLLNSTLNFTHNFWEFCIWTRREKELSQLYDSFLNLKVFSTEAILFLTSILERSLGNVFLMKGQNVPALLRDLLATPELFSILGSIPIVFLQMLMGTPLALNLRNVTWHGFPQPDELPRQFVSTLYVVVASIGELLSAQDITLNTIPLRTQMCYSPDLFKGCFPDVQDHKDEVLQILSSSPYIDSAHYLYWESGLQHYINSQFGECLLLLLPQLEHLLRCIFCSVNDCLERVLTAESTTLYITLTEIMAEHQPMNDDSQQNNIRHVFGDSGMEILQDIFTHQSGPRIRDKLSHGECEPVIPQAITNHVLCVALAIVLIAEKGQTWKEGLASDSVTNVELHSFEDKLMHAYKTYISKFHPSTLLQMSIISVVNHLDQWKTYPCPDSSEVNYNSLESINCGDTDLINLQCKLLTLTDGYKDRTNVVCSEVLREYVLALRIQTVFRPKTENEMLSILRHIIDGLQLICDQIEEHLRHKYALHCRHEMRSRQRDTYQRMLHVVPYLNQVIYCVLLIVSVQFGKVNSVDILPGKIYQQKLRFLKQVLQFVENIVSYTDMKRSRWQEAGVLAEKFVQNMNKALCNTSLL